MKIYKIENQITIYKNMNQVTDEKLMRLYSSRFSALLIRFPEPHQYIDPGRLFQSRTIRMEKEYLYGLPFAGLA